MKRQYFGFVVVMLLVGSACAGSSDPATEGGDDSGGSVQDQAVSPASGVSDSGPTQDAPEGSSGADVTDTGSDSKASAEGGSFDRDSFVLCRVLEEHKDELAAIVGFEADPERGVETFSDECNIRGSEPGNFARVQLVPNFTPSILFHIEGYEGLKMPAPELGAEAVSIENDFQPDVVLLLGDFIIDVDAEVIDYETGLTAPPSDAMIAYAARVRDLLTEANA